MINYRDRLLMGQYPAGELFEVEGDELETFGRLAAAAAGAGPSARKRRP